MDRYKEDFPEEGCFDWVCVKLLKTNHKIIGVLLHDGNFAINSKVFESNEFTVIDYDPGGNPAFWKSLYDKLTEEDLKNPTVDNLHIINNTVKRNRK